MLALASNEPFYVLHAVTCINDNPILCPSGLICMIKRIRSLFNRYDAKTGLFVCGSVAPACDNAFPLSLYGVHFIFSLSPLFNWILVHCGG